ncbi:MAG: GNAT family N-acetyltransferase [Candidatus Acidiferrum sp.]
MPHTSTEPSIYPISLAYILAHPATKRLFDEYAAECAQPELGDPCPQSDLYEAMEKCGTLRTFGVFSGEHLIGFASLLIYVLPHYGKKIATTESIFVTEDSRKTGAGQKLLDFIEHYAKQNECVAVLYTAPTGSQFSQVLESKSRYRHSNNVFIRKLS